ncbi:MAG: tyrosine transporter [Parachlamydiales bacterium]|nr:tyrosine transporter [Parachlamydiales bacterium]
MKRELLQPGSMFGGMMLIAGSCIGAGMLALPVLMGLCGLSLSLVMLFLSWAFMTFTALLLVEVNGWFYKQVNIVSMAETAFGKIGRLISWMLYLFLFYSLLVAYIAASGDMVSHYLSRGFPAYMASIFFVCFFGVIVYFGTKPVDFLNRFFMIGLVIFYMAMIVAGSRLIHFSYFRYIDFKYFLFPLPVLITSFGFHNMIPSLTAYMKGNLRRMRYTILGGSLIALCVYLIWVVLVLGSVPTIGKGGLLEGYRQGIESSQILQNALSNPWVVFFSGGFAFFAIITSFLAQSLGLMHFLADGLKVELSYRNNGWLCLLALAPPTLCALIYPGIFFQALNFAGGFCAVILFGLLPALMAWHGRYGKKITSSYHVTGGKLALIAIIIFSTFVAVSELVKLAYKMGINKL